MKAKWATGLGLSIILAVAAVFATVSSAVVGGIALEILTLFKLAHYSDDNLKVFTLLAGVWFVPFTLGSFHSRGMFLMLPLNATS